jgi:hypothetical protein
MAVASQLWAIGPGESCPDRAGGVVAIDAPVGGEGADDIEPVMSCRVTRLWSPWTAAVFDFNLGVIAWADSGSDGEGAAGQAGAAVEDGVGGSSEAQRTTSSAIGQ